MKTTVSLFLLLSSLAASAATEITCWNIQDEKGSAPTFSANIESVNVLTNLKFDLKSDYFSHYFFDKVTGEKSEKSYLENPTLEQRPEEITTGRSPYKGHNEYAFEIGRASFRTPYFNKDTVYEARLVLPKDLSPEALKATVLSPGVRSNGVVILDPSAGVPQSGKSYLRMFCVSK